MVNLRLKPPFPHQKAAPVRLRGERLQGRASPMGPAPPLGMRVANPGDVPGREQGKMLRTRCSWWQQCHKGTKQPWLLVVPRCSGRSCAPGAPAGCQGNAAATFPPKKKSRGAAHGVETATETSEAQAERLPSQPRDRFSPRGVLIPSCSLGWRYLRQAKPPAHSRPPGAPPTIQPPTQGWIQPSSHPQDLQIFPLTLGELSPACSAPAAGLSTLPQQPAPTCEPSLLC